jgi:hypothetical protein
VLGSNSSTRSEHSRLVHLGIANPAAAKILFAHQAKLADLALAPLLQQLPLWPG